MFIKRRITRQIVLQRDKFPVLAVTGPRQSGKTTLLRRLFEDYRYVTLENPDNQQFAASDPVGFLDYYGRHVIFDEVQRVPHLFSYIQERVDESGLMGHYILSGSQNFHLLKSITQSLAGRVALFKLLPLDFAELTAQKLLADGYPSVAISGAYPAIFDRDISPAVFYANYLQTYVEKDVTELLNVRDTRKFRQFLGLCGARAGQLLNISALANECDITFNTAKSWLSILESSYLVFLLQPYHQNRNKRLVKTPKLYFYDTGLLCHLLGINDAGQLETDRLKGSVFENMVIAEYQKRNYHLYEHLEFFFWQDTHGNEIDLLWQVGQTFHAVEIKATKTITNELFKQLDKFETHLAPSTPIQKTLVYGGADSQHRTNYEVKSWREVAD
ncbi:ATPase [Parapedobacter defluvii]|uniref:ATPase n=1 Tax=Parapedobacter defluvii TaxID=2045106 RepID=A0ABQ1MKA3_9SPHI|nr:ATP-binding protein [Parapedobacter defluvii]GGC38762.1 ATPase [Parapedobacter defluvii]